MAESEPFLEAVDVTVRFGGLVAVDGITLRADRGEIMGVIGPNGAGKSTLFGAIAGTVTPTRGHVRLGGQPATRWSPHRRARAGLGRTFQRLEVFGSMTVAENLAFATEAGAIGNNPLRLLARDRWRRPEVVASTIDLLGLADVADRPAGELPTGRARLVELGRALCAQPAVVLLDEPSSGLDAAESAAFADAVERAVARTGLGVVLVEHDMSVVLRLAQRLHVLDFGALIAEGPTADVAKLDRVRAAYLGDIGDLDVTSARVDRNAPEGTGAA